MSGLSFANITLLHLIIVLLPIYQKPLALVIAIWALTAIFLFKKSNFKITKAALFLALFYVFLIGGVFWSEEKAVANFDLEVKLSLVIFPLFLSAIPISKEQLLKLVRTFAFSLLGTSIILLIQGIIMLIETGDFYMLFYANLSPIIHPSYLSFYFCLAIFALCYNLIYQSFNFIKSKWLNVTLIGWFLLFNFMLLSKIGILSTILMVIFFSIIWIKKSKKYWHGLGAFLTMILILFLAYNTSRFFKQRTDELVYSLTTNDPTYSSGSSSMRTKIWNECFELIKENPFLGYGTGDVKHELMKRYEQKGLVNELNLQLNAHNAFFQIIIAIGFFGFIVFLLSLFLAFKESLKNKNHLLIAFIMLFLLFGSTESLLENQAGTIFFGLFFILLNKNVVTNQFSIEGKDENLQLNNER